MQSRWIVVASVLTFGCAQPKTETASKPAKLISGSCRRPAYPEEAARAGQTGDVSVKFLVDSKGDVINTSIEKSSGFPILDDAAARALKTCRFEPAVKEGVAVESETSLLYKWRLAGPDPRETPPMLIAGSCVAIPVETVSAGEHGTMKALVFVDKTGAVTGVEMKQSSGSFRLDSAVVEMLRTSCKYQPATSKGTAVDAAILYSWKPAH